MDRSYIDDNHVVARYLADQLSDADRQAFESCLMTNPEMVQEVEATARLKAGLMRLRDTGELESLLRPRSRYEERTHALSRSLRKHAAAAIAALVIIAIGGAFLLEPRSTAQPWIARASTSLLDELGHPLPMGGTYTILRTRSAADVDMEIPLPPGRQAIALRILPEMTAMPAIYRVKLYARGNEAGTREVAAIGGLIPGPDEFVPLYLDSSRFAPGSYRLTISGDTGTNGASDESAFTFRIQPGDGAVEPVSSAPGVRPRAPGP